MTRKRIFRDDEDILILCPYRQAVCELPGDIECPLREQLCHLTALRDWDAKRLTAASCEYKGQQLSALQYKAKKIGIII